MRMLPTMFHCLGVRKLCPSGPKIPGFSTTLIALCSLFITLLQSEVSAQCALACRSKGNISLAENCEARVLASMLLTKGLNCPDARYRVDVMDYNMKLIPTSPVLTEDWVGKHVTVRVFDSTSLNSCWGTLYVEDKFPPIIECHTDTMYCNDVRYRQAPHFYDYCDPNASIRLVDEIFFPFYCDSHFVKIVVRAWSATDKYGNNSPICRDTTWLARVPIDSVTFPKNYTRADSCHIECGSNYLTDANGHPHPDVTDVPRIEGIPLWPDYNVLCNVGTSYEDAVLIDNGCKKKILRMWRIVEWWCGTAVVRTHPQTIEIVDTEPPHIHCPYDITASTNLGYGCLARILMPPIVIEDNCQDSFYVTIQYPGGVLRGQNGGYIELETGEHNVVYIVSDACGNIEACTVHVSVTDKNPPTMVCDQGIIVALTRDDVVHVEAKIFDENTHDDCNLDRLLVRRMDRGAPCGAQDTVFRPEVEFCCEDAGKKVMVILRAYDEAGNFNDCMVEAEIQDKTPPVIRCPHDYSISCGTYLDTMDLSHFGGPYYYDNCIVQMTERVDTSLNQCGIGYLGRWFVITDNMGRKDSCLQKIFVNPTVFFDENDITWPKDTTIFSCGADIEPGNLPDGYGYPIFNRVVCSHPATSYEDHQFRYIQDSALCFKVLRKWKVLDWCQQKVDSQGNVYIPTWTHTQVIKVSNKLPPKLLDDCEDLMVCISGNECLKTRVQVSHGAVDDCTPDDLLKSSFKLDLYNNGLFDSTYQTQGARVSWDGDLPIGEHRFVWVFEDQCGNKEVCDQLVRVANCKGPTAYCLSGIAVNLSSMDVDGDGRPEGVVDVWASDVDRGSYQLCGNPVVVSFSSDTTDKFRRFTCDSLGQRRVEVWVTDRYTGLQDFCVSTVVVQDNNRLCPRRLTGTLAGLLKAPGGKVVEEVEIQVESSQAHMDSKASGNYSFLNIPLGQDYDVRALKEENYLEGVTTLDILQIQKHILGTQEIESPWQKLAADANSDARITGADIAAIRRLILGYDYKFKNSRSWKFTHATYQFPDPSDPWYQTLPEEYRIRDMAGDMMYMDFVGIKVGDVSKSSWDELSKATERSVQSLVLDAGIPEEEGRVVPVRISESARLQGMQFTLHFDPGMNMITGIRSGALDINGHFVNYQFVSDGVVLLSWTRDEEISLEPGTELFRLEFRDPVNEDFRNSIFAGSDVIRAEAYDGELGIYKIEWNSVVTQEDKEVVFGIPIPNPFAEMTVLPMDVKQDTEFTVRLFDINGTELYSQKDLAAKGRNYIRVRKSQFPKPGVYLLRVETGAYSRGFKLVVMEN